MPTKIASNLLSVFLLAWLSFDRFDPRLIFWASRPGGSSSVSAAVAAPTDCPIPSALPCQIGGS